MDQDHPLNPVVAAARPLQCSCGVTLRRFTITGTGTTRQIERTPARTPQERPRCRLKQRPPTA